MKLKGTILRFDEPNINGFMYSKECGEKIIEQLYESINSKSMFGELRLDGYYGMETREDKR